MLQHGRADSYRVATIPANYDDNKTADGRAKVFVLKRKYYLLQFIFTTFSSCITLYLYSF